MYVFSQGIWRGLLIGAGLVLIDILDEGFELGNMCGNLVWLKLKAYIYTYIDNDLHTYVTYDTYQ